MSNTKVHAINNQEVMVVATRNATLAEIMAEKSTIDIRRDAAKRRIHLEHRAMVTKTVNMRQSAEITAEKEDFRAGARLRKQQRNAERSSKRKLREI